MKQNIPVLPGLIMVSGKGGTFLIVNLVLQVTTVQKLVFNHHQASVMVDGIAYLILVLLIQLIPLMVVSVAQDTFAPLDPLVPFHVLLAIIVMHLAYPTCQELVNLAISVVERQVPPDPKIQEQVVFVHVDITVQKDLHFLSRVKMATILIPLVIVT